MNFETHLSQKKQFRFNELTSLVGVKPYVLRFWESEFDQIAPRVLEDGQKIYSSKDLEALEQIKKLLFSSKLSIPEAKKQLDENIKEAQKKEQAESIRENVVKMQRVNSAYTNRQSVTSQSSSLDLMKMALAQELKVKEKNTLSDRSISDKDIVHLIQAKKKLTNVLGRMDELISQHNW